MQTHYSYRYTDNVTYYPSYAPQISRNVPASCDTLFVSQQGVGNRITPVAQSYWTRRNSSLMGKSWCSDGSYTIGAVIPYTMFPPSSISAPWDRLYNEALSQLNDSVRGSLDLSVDVAEAGQTIRMLSQYRPTLQNLFRGVSRFVSYARSVKGASREIGSKWLEYQYGWRPLIQDVFETASLLMDPENPLPIHLKARSHDTIPESQVFNYVGYNSLVSGQVSFRCEIGMVVSPPSSRLQGLAKFTSLNPASIAWELLPFSFVADWFFNVGGYLRNLETALTFDSVFRYGYVTYTSSRECSVSALGSNSGPGFGFSGRGSIIERTKGRSILSSYPMPRAPVFHADLGSGRLLNAAALLTQFLGR